jgi:hypothetical protein
VSTRPITFPKTSDGASPWSADDYSRQIRPFIRRIKAYRDAHNNCPLAEARDAILAEDHAEALRMDAEHTRQHQNEQILAGLDENAIQDDDDFRPADRPSLAALHRRWLDQGLPASTWEAWLRQYNEQILAGLDSLNRNAPLCMRTSLPEHVSHMYAVRAECRETTDLHPVDEGMAPAEMRERGLIPPYMWADTDPHATA